MTDYENVSISIETDLKRELEEFNFKYRRTDFKINVSDVCRNALRSELSRKKIAAKLAGLDSSQSSQGVELDADPERLPGYLPDPGEDPGQQQEDSEQDSSQAAEKKLKPCVICGKTFEYQRSSAKTCSGNCRQKLLNKKRNEA